MKIKAIFIVILIIIYCFTSCVNSNSGGVTAPSLGGVPMRLTPEEDKIAVFSQGSPDGFWARNDRGNGPPFNCSFQRSNAVISNDILTLSLTKGGDKGFIGAEYRSSGYFSFGYYSVSMKAAKCPGVISSFFTYTGWPWDEIDIEFLGDDTTKVQFNYYTNGVGGHEYVHYLGFDASEDFHEYGFDWQPDSITWYVDGKAVYQATQSIPSHPGQIMMNIWNVADTNANWAGKFDESGIPVHAQYQWIGYHSADEGAIDK
jgi:endoglucanase